MSIRCLCMERYGRMLPSCADQRHSMWQCPIRQEAQKMKDEYDQKHELTRQRAHNAIDALVNAFHERPDRNV